MADTANANDSRQSAKQDALRDAPATAPTPFMNLARDRARLAADWLRRSIEACRGSGSSRFYSRIYSPIRGWSYAYPETTGYIIPTLIRFAAWDDQPEFATLAMKQADWVCALQAADGSLPGSHVTPGKPLPPASIFNTGQMILGLVAAADHSRDSAYLDAAERAARWLASLVDPQTHTWHGHAYVSGYSPAYYTRVCWPMLKVWCRRNDDLLRDAAAGVLNTIAGWQQKNGAFRNWGFVAHKPAYTHTIAYTIRGLWESADLLGASFSPGMIERLDSDFHADGRNDAGGNPLDLADRFALTALRSADVFRRKLELRGRLAGAYDTDLQGVFWYTCLTGNCQFAILWMRIYAVTGDGRFLSAALKALQVAIDRQLVRPVNSQLRGALAGSWPNFGRYLFLRYPNWAPKFLLDALMDAHDQLAHLQHQGPPCASS